MALVFAKDALIQFAGTKISDHNREGYSFEPDFIKNDVRTANGTLRRDVVAIKNEFSMSWSELPYEDAETIDGFMGAENLINFIQANTGSWALTVTEHDATTTTYTVMFDSFDWELVARYDTHYYDISVTLIEV